MSAINTTAAETVTFILEPLRSSLSRRDYKSVPKLWEEFWFVVRAPAMQDELPALRERYGPEIGELINATRLHIKQKRISADIAPRLQSIAAKIVKK